MKKMKNSMIHIFVFVIAVIALLFMISLLSGTAISAPTVTLDSSITNTATVSLPKLIKVKVSSTAGISAVNLKYIGGGDPAFTNLKMFDDGAHDDDAANDGVYANKIPLSKINLKGAAYYVKATDNNGEDGFFPVGGESNPVVLTIIANISGPEYDDGTHGDSKKYDLSLTSSPIPAWTSSSDWTMISFPVILSDHDPEKIFAVWGKPEDDWQAYRFEGGADYSRAIKIARPGNPKGDIEKFTLLERGKAAWVWTPVARKIDITGATAADPSRSYAIQLKSGWNQIGNPFRFTRYWDNKTIKVGTTNDITKAIPILDAAAQGLVADPPIIYLRSGETYQKISANPATVGLNVVPYPGSFEPWQGYWFSAKQDVWLFVDAYLAEGPTHNPPVIGPMFNAKPVSPNPPNGTWMVELKADGVSIVAGMAPNASNLEDAMDIPNPPLVPGIDSISFNFPHLGWDDKHVNSYEQDIRKLDKSAIWKIAISSEQPKTVKLMWKQLYSLPKGYELFLVDEAADKTIDLSKESSYLLKNFSGSRKFYLIASFKGAGIPDSLARAIVTKTELGQNFPNPFNPETWIPFKLSEESLVLLKIYSASGKLIRRIYLGRMPVGIYTSKDKAIYWDGKNDMGESVSSGVYFYQLGAGNRRLTKKMIVRK
jgi:hypothetical protein